VGKKQPLRFLATLHAHHIHLKEGTNLAGFSGDAFIHQDVTPINAGQALNPRSEVDGIADDSHVHPLMRTDVPEDRRSVADANTRTPRGDPQGVAPFIDGRKSLLHLECGEDRILRILLAIGRSQAAPGGHQGVPDEFVERP
jgi:hypothetical protein